MYDAESQLPTVLRTKLPPNLEKIKYGTYTTDDWDYPIHLYLKENDIRVDETGSEVIKFLRGKSILITGATGFLGKLLVEKLLRCCKDIGTIYIIVRTKKGKNVETRVKEYLDNWVFVKLSEIYPNFREKIVGISGDLEEEGIGLSDESRKILTEKVNIIFHAAATIRFDEKLKKAIQINIKGTKEILRLAKDCKNIEVMTHIGTAYSNCHEKHIKEEFYPPIMDAQTLIQITDMLPSDVVDKITPGLLNGSPNTYTFTKQIAEDLLKTESVGIPTCLHRPSIVIATASEPIRSWVDNIFGPVGMVEAAATGILHTTLGNEDYRVDMVPADYVINNCIVATYKTAKDRITDKVQIFNFTTAENNPLYLKSLMLAGVKGRKVGSTKILKWGFFRCTRCWYWYIFLNFIFHTIPGHFVDFILVRMGKKPLLTKAYQKVNKFTEVLSHFSLNTWSFDSINSVNLSNILNEKDKKIFPFDMRTLDWQNYFNTYLVAMREFLVHEFLDNLEEGRAYLKMLKIIHYTSVITSLVLSTYFFINTIFCFIPITIITIIIFYVSFKFKSLL